MSLLRRLKILFFGRKHLCPKCLGWGINCYTCDEEGMPLIEDMAVHAFGCVEIRTCDLHKCDACGGAGFFRGDEPVLEEIKVSCLSCGMARGNVKSSPIID